MPKRTLSSSSSETQLSKKSKAKPDESAKEKISRNVPKKHDLRTAKKTSGTTKHQSNSILSYFLPQCPAVASRSKTIIEPSSSSSDIARIETGATANKKLSAKTNHCKQQICNEYCPRCQMPAVSLNDPLFQDHVSLCIERVFDFEGPCPKGLTCDEQSSDHFKTYNHDILAENRSTHTNTSHSKVQKDECLMTEKDNIGQDDLLYNHDILPENHYAQANRSHSKAQINECLMQEKDDIVHSDLQSPKVKTGKSIKMSPFKKLADKMESIHKLNGSFSQSFSKLGAADVHEDNLDEMTDYRNYKERITVTQKNLFDDNIDDDDDKLSGNNKTVYNLPFCLKSQELFPKDDDDNGDSDDMKHVPLCQVPEDHFCEHDDNTDDEILANLVNSDDIDFNITPKNSSKCSLLDNKCPQDAITANIPISTLEKEQTSNNKFISINNPIESCTIQTKPQASGSTLTKQSDIGTYFGLQPLKKPIEQPNTQYKATVDDADSVDDGNIGGYGGKRKCPFYKKIPGTPFVVDAFDYGVIPGAKAYFLSHFHYDHYKGLKPRFSNTIYCSKITANLVKSKIKVDHRFVKELPMNEPQPVDKVQVTLLEANHCPGAVLFLFELPTGETYLHTGDFRASPSMEEYKDIKRKHIHTLFLDTTYCDPAHSFPSQDEMIQFAVRKSLEAKQRNPKTLIVCGTYTIGKEKVFLAIAEALGCKVSVARDKKRILDCFEYDTVSSLVTVDWNAGGVHVLRMCDLKFATLKKHLDKYKKSFNELLAFKPTGWEHNARSSNDIRPTKSGPVTIYGVPYSEHSSYKELERFVKFIKPDKVIATVNVRSAEQTAILNSWISNKKVEGKKKYNFQ